LIVEKDPFQFWTDNAKLVFQRGDVRVYSMDEEEYLFVDQVMYASTTERGWYTTHAYPRAKGKCLEIGLGLGVASKVMLATRAVTHLLTVEKNENVIAAFGRPLSRHNILNVDVNEWLSKFPELVPMYDFIFVDHYTFEEEELVEIEELSVILKQLLKPGGKIVFWVDENAPDEDQEQIRKLWI